MLLVVALVIAVAGAFAAGAIVPSMLRDDVAPPADATPAADVLADEDSSSDDDPAPPDEAESPEGSDDPAEGDEPDGDDPAGAEGDSDDDAPVPDAAAELDLPAWLVIVRSLTADERSYEDAESAAADLRDAGLEDVAVLRSDDLAGLEPGYWVLYAGAWPDEDDAVARCEAAAETTDCYVRRVDAPDG